MEQAILIEAARKILAQNPHCLLSGGLVLNMQKLKTRREPEDIDIYLPFGQIFNVLKDSMYEIDDDDSMEGYDDEEFSRTSYYITEENKRIKVDVFTPVSQDIPSQQECNSIHNGFKCVRYDYIIRFKIFHTFNTSRFTKWKHRDDIICLMANNAYVTD